MLNIVKILTEWTWNCWIVEKLTIYAFGRSGDGGADTLVLDLWHGVEGFDEGGGMACVGSKLWKKKGQMLKSLLSLNWV